MPSLPDAHEMLDREFLQVRARLLEIASALDRIDRAAGNSAAKKIAGGKIEGDGRLRQFRQALDVLAGADGDRAERVQMIFSLPYAPDWKQAFGFEHRGS